MKILPINTGYYQPKVNKQTKQPAFKSKFNEYLIDVLGTQIKDKWHADTLFWTLCIIAKDEPGCKLHRGAERILHGNTLYQKLCSVKDAAAGKIPQAFEDDYCSPLISSNGKTLIAHDLDRVCFLGDRSEDMLQFFVDNHSDVVVDKPYERFVFSTDTGFLKKKTSYSGSGFTASSQTTYYKKDGSENEWRNFLDTFGI